jgi:hypothetical protein
MPEEAQNLEEQVRHQFADLEVGDGKTLGARLQTLTEEAKELLQRQIIEYSTTTIPERLHELRAEERRTIADGSHVPEVKISYEAMARHYDRMASFAKQPFSK